MPVHRSTSDASCIPRERGGFTLIELLVVISIIALLIAILLPALSSARRSTYNIQCLSNLKQLAIWGTVYATESNGALPHNGKPASETGYGTTGKDWFEDVDWHRYGNFDDSAFLCPQLRRSFTEIDSSFHYALNDTLGGRLRTPPPAWQAEWYPQTVPTDQLLDSEQFWFGDANINFTPDPPTISKFLNIHSTSMPWNWDFSHNATRHPNDAQNFSFGDGHAESVPWTLYQSMSGEKARRLTGQAFPFPQY